MAISYKHKIYTTLGTPTTLSEDVVSVTNSVGVPTKDYTIKGKTIVWNQLLQNGIFNDSTGWTGVQGSISVSNNVLKYIPNSTTGTSHRLKTTFETQKNGKYFVSAIMTAESAGTGVIEFSRGYVRLAKSLSANSRTVVEGIMSIGGDEDEYSVLQFFVNDSDDLGSVTFTIERLFVCNLTLMFGTGNEPATAAEFRTMFPNDYYPYNVGELKSIEPTGIEVIGLNQLKLSGRTEISDDRTPTSVYTDVDSDVFYKGLAANGYLQASRIENYAISDSSISLKGTMNVYGIGFPMKASPNTTYYIYMTGSGKYVRASYLDSGKKIIGFTDTENPIEQFTTPANCAYIIVIFLANPADAEIKFENICVSTLQTTEYKPYSKRVQTIDTVKYFPDGMRSAGSVYDEINFSSQKAIKRIGSVDLGTLNWTYESTASHERFTANVSGMKLASATSVKGNIVCSKYITTSADDIWLHTADKTIASHNTVAQVWVYDSAYTDAAAFKSAMSGVMLYYELATSVETTITPSLQALSTFKGFTSFSAPNSLTQNGPFSVTYYAEGGENPEKGWLTSYKRKLYMGKNIVWNQLFDKNATPSRNSTAITYSVDGDMNTLTTTSAITISQFNFQCSTVSGHKYMICAKSLEWISPNHSNLFVGKESHPDMASYAILTSSDLSKFFTATGDTCYIKSYISYSVGNYEFRMNGLQLFDLTQMFGEDNEPETTTDFWSYFPHKVYPYNAGETQPLFKISRKNYLYSVEQPKLATPTNLSISGNVLSFDSVEGATSYNILADGTSIGVYVPS